MIICPQCGETMPLHYQANLTDLSTDTTGRYTIYHHSSYHSDCHHHTFVPIDVLRRLPRLGLEHRIPPGRTPW